MSDWQVGDLAVVVALQTKGDTPRTDKNTARKGDVFRVTGVIAVGRQTGLLLEGKCSNHPSGAFCSTGFRKIRPDEHTACESEFIDLLKRSKVSA